MSTAELVPPVSLDTIHFCDDYISLPDYPLVAFDVGLGQHVDFIDVNYDKLTDYHGRGVTEGQVNSTKIYFADSRGEVDDGTGRIARKYACYVAEYDTILVNSRADTLEVAIEAIDAGIKDEELSDYCSRVASQAISRTLAHELEHRKVHFDGSFEQANQRYAAKIAQQLINGEITPRKAYLNNPEEAHCRAIEKTAPTDLVTVRITIPKSPSEP